MWVLIEMLITDLNVQERDLPNTTYSSTLTSATFSTLGSCSQPQGLLNVKENDVPVVLDGESLVVPAAVRTLDDVFLNI